ncbi:HEAT repeat domain-containing protein [Streptomyces sp. NPDC006733]|uniref:HEAT repeat domain-containing protein n=1 Tax=Streptomyces sp. NPDC006733 TaxID=3155460 RepID=UPI0033D4A95A
MSTCDLTGALSRGLTLIASDDPAERATGCDVLGDASDRNEAVRAEAASALLRLAERESEHDVLRSLAEAIGSTGDQRAVPVLIALAGHQDAEVRRGAACSFAWVATGRPDGSDVRALIALTRDQDPEVRNWATFTLGFQLEADSPAIRAALWERTTDGDPDAREEGIHGLARRRDRRAVPLLVGLLEAPEGAHVRTFGAARIMGVPELLPALLGYEPDGVGVTAAVSACDPRQRARLDAAAWELVCALHRLRPDLDASVSMPLFDHGMSLGLVPARGSAGYDVAALLERANGDPARAAELVASDLPAGGALLDEPEGDVTEDVENGPAAPSPGQQRPAKAPSTGGDPA